MRFTLKNPRSLQYIDYQNVRKNGIFRLSKSGNLQIPGQDDFYRTSIVGGIGVTFKF